MSSLWSRPTTSAPRAGQPERDQPGAGGDVEDALAGAGVDRVDERAAPARILAEAEHGAHPVVGARQARRTARARGACVGRLRSRSPRLVLSSRRSGAWPAARPGGCGAGRCRACGRRGATTSRRADDHRGELGAGDRGVEHLAAQEERAGGRVGDDHRDRQLDPLAAVDRAGVGEAQAIGLLGREAEDRRRRRRGAARPRRSSLAAVRSRRAAAAASRSSGRGRAGCARSSSACRRSAAGRRGPARRPG